MAKSGDRLRKELADAMNPYVPLLQALVAGQLSADDFQTEYFDRYLNDARGCSDEVFNIVDAFFAEVDAYVDDPDLRDPAAGDIGPEELLARARELLRRAGYDA